MARKGRSDHAGAEVRIKGAMGDRPKTAPEPHDGDETLDDIQKLLARSRRLQKWTEQLRAFGKQIEKQSKKDEPGKSERSG